MRSLLREEKRDRLDRARLVPLAPGPLASWPEGLRGDAGRATTRRMDEMPDEHDVLRDTLDDAFGDDPTRRSVAQAALTRLADELKSVRFGECIYQSTALQQWLASTGIDPQLVMHQAQAAVDRERFGDLRVEVYDSKSRQMRCYEATLILNDEPRRHTHVIPNSQLAQMRPDEEFDELLKALQKWIGALVLEQADALGALAQCVRRA